MGRIVRFELTAVDLPLRGAVRHAAAERSGSESLFLKCVTSTGADGFGESLPRPYVTGEKREESFRLLVERILPRLVGARFEDLGEALAFLRECDGRAPPDWVPASEPQSAAWAAVDLALLDALGRETGRPLALAQTRTPSPGFRYSAVVPTGGPRESRRRLAKVRAYGFRRVKLKLDAGEPARAVRQARRWLGAHCELRVDANMAWGFEEARRHMRELSALGVRSFEQPLRPEALGEAARLVAETGLPVMADEGFCDRPSLAAQIAKVACTHVNVRVSKCGGLVGALERCRQARDAGLGVQIGCQVGESSLLSAAHLLVMAAQPRVEWGEGCFGRHLLAEDPVSPPLQFGYGGQPPRLPVRPGLSVEVDEAALRRLATATAVVDG